MEPREAALAAEVSPVPHGTDERFSGFGVMGVPFSSGHLLALRRFPVSTVGPAYNAVWHRDPEGRWTMASTVAPEESCPRYFGDAVDRQLVADVRLDWTGPRTLRVAVPAPLDLDWTVTLVSTPITRAMSAACGAVPERLWRRQLFSQAMGSTASACLRTGTLRLSGSTPNRQRFVARPRRVWLVEGSWGSAAGDDLGTPRALPQQAALGDFWLPQRGLFMVGWSAFAAEPAATAL
jgi:hypothetical protein